jgi:hypothetical protein
MSEHLRAAREQVQQAIAHIDVRLAELADEAGVLRATREQLRTVIEGHGTAGAAGTLTSEVRHAEVVATSPPAAGPVSPPARSVPSHDSGSAKIGSVNNARARARWPHIDAAILTAVRANPGCRPQDIGARLEGTCRPYDLKSGLARLVQQGALTLTGYARGARYSLPTGRASRSAARPAPDSPADDDSHGATREDISAGGNAGMSCRSTDAEHPIAVARRPPAEFKSEQIVTSSESLGKDSNHHRPGETDAGEGGRLEDEDVEIGHDEDASADDVTDMDELARLDAEPIDMPPPATTVARRKTTDVPAYKPGTRQADAKGAAAGSPPWWASTDPKVWHENQKRLRDKPTRLKTPGENNIIGMNANF